MNRGLFIGVITDGKLHLKKSLKIGEGIAVWDKEGITGKTIKKIIKDKMQVTEAVQGDIIDIGINKKGSFEVYKTSSPFLACDLGDSLNLKAMPSNTSK